MKTAVLSAISMFGLAFVISMAVAVLIKALYVVVRRMSGSN